jgi:hypothetical protein
VPLILLPGLRTRLFHEAEKPVRDPIAKGRIRVHEIDVRLLAAKAIISGTSLTGSKI